MRRGDSAKGATSWSRGPDSSTTSNTLQLFHYSTDNKSCSKTASLANNRDRLCASTFRAARLTPTRLTAYANRSEGCHPTSAASACLKVDAPGKSKAELPFAGSSASLSRGMSVHFLDFAHRKQPFKPMQSLLLRHFGPAFIWEHTTGDIPTAVLLPALQSQLPHLPRAPARHQG